MTPGPQTLVGIVDQAVQVCRIRWRFILSTVVACSIPLAAVAAAGLHWIAATNLEGPRLAGLAVALTLCVALRAVGWGAAVLGLKAWIEGREADASACLGTAFRRIGGLFVAHAWPLSWALLGALLTAAPVALASLASTERNPVGSIGVGILASGAGAGILIGISIYVARRSIALAAAAHESAPGLGALRRSRDLVLGHTVRPLVLLGFLLFLTAVACLSLVLLGPALVGVAGTLTGSPLTALAALVSPGNTRAVVFACAAAFVLLDPVRCLALALLYADMRVRREGADLRARLDAWASTRRGPVAEESPR